MIMYFKEQDIRADALEEGRQEESCRIARNMLNKGMSLDVIREMTGISQADLHFIQEQLNAD